MLFVGDKEEVCIKAAREMIPCISSNTDKRTPLVQLVHLKIYQHQLTLLGGSCN